MKTEKYDKNTKGGNIKTKQRLNLGITAAAVIIIVVLVNILVGILADRFNAKIDLTSNKLYELSEKTQEYLSEYETPTTIYILASEAEQDDRVRSVLDNYAAANKNITVKNINMKENPTFGKGYVSGDETLSANSIIVDSGSRHKIFTRTQLHEVDDEIGDSLNVENNITAALKYVSSDVTMKAYFTKGHNENEIKGVINKLTAENYEIGDITTLTEDIPQDTNLLMIINPTVDFSENEISKLEEYLSNGGNIQIYFNVGNHDLPNFYSFIESWGIKVNNDVVLENNSSKILPLGNSSQSLTITNILADSDFTADLIKKKRSLAYITNSSKSLTQASSQRSDVSVIPVLGTSEHSYTSTNYEDVTQGISENEQVNIVAALAMDTANNSSVYVCGNTFLLQNDDSVLSTQFSLANYEYFMNLINYTLNNGESFIVNKKMLLDGNITVSKTASTVIMIFVVFIIPIVLLLIGFVIWIKRRNL